MNEHFDDEQPPFDRPFEKQPSIPEEHREVHGSAKRGAEPPHGHTRRPAPVTASGCADAPGQDQATNSAATSNKGGGRKVLIADDNRDSAESIAMIFRIYGHEVEVVYDGEAAVTAFVAFEPHFVLLDIGMPKLNGYEVAKRIRAAAGTRMVTLVALTGWGQESDKERAFAAGFDHHFTKPVDPERLSALITA